jgi:hypothetical protein
LAAAAVAGLCYSLRDIPAGRIDCTCLSSFPPVPHDTLVSWLLCLGCRWLSFSPVTTSTVSRQCR